MEDLWKEITLSTLSSDLHNRQTPIHHHHHHHFQDFLGRPFTLDHTKNSLLLSASSPAPQTILSLSTDSSSGNSLPNFDNTTLQKSGSDEMSLSSSQLPSDRRFKRMIKNRESAARSRARKQALTNELELEVAHLKQENARLRREQEMRNQAALDRCPKKHKLHRTSTAPF